VKPEEKAREIIDELLLNAGWQIQDFNSINLGSASGIAVRDVPLKTGEADYLLFLDRKAIGAIEAKPVGTTLSGVEPQSEKYVRGVPETISYIQKPLPFAYESTGRETRFTDLRDPDYRSRNLYTFHRPETLKRWISKDETLRTRLQKLPPLYESGLRDCQIEAIKGLETSFARNRPKSLVQMASGGGKTYTAVTLSYRLIKFARAEQILFLVDRTSLGRQTFREFSQYPVPLDGRKFTDLYNIQHLTSNVLDPTSRVCISTIQRLYSMLKGEPELEIEREEISLFEAPLRDVQETITYNPHIPIETFDFIIVDECHRSIYDTWRQILEYFDAFIIGLTATPSLQTLGFFDQNLVTEYSHERAVADNVNVGYDVYRIETHITRAGSEVKAGYYVDKRDKLTRKVRWEQLDEDLTYSSSQLDRDVVAPDQIRTVIKTFRDNLFCEIFPGRIEVPKTLIFAKDDSHAEDIVKIVREEFGKGNEFCQKITYKTTGVKIEELIASFRNSYIPRIAVTVDMISTGTDIRPLECLIFMRNVKSRIYFEQMKGRGTRTIIPDDLQSVTPDAQYKTHFVIVDAVGVCESDKTDSRPLERKRSVSFEKLIQSIALGSADEDTLTSLAGRLARLNKRLDGKDKALIEEVSGKPLEDIVNTLLDAVDPDKKIELAKESFNTEEPSKEQLEETSRELVHAVEEIFDNPEVRSTLIDIKQRNEQTIDTVSQDKLLYSGFDPQATDRAHTLIDTFNQFIADNKDELTALQMIYSKPYRTRQLTFNQIRELAEAIEKPPYNLTTDLLWQAYEQLEQSKVKRTGPQKLLTDIISLVRYAAGESTELEPYFVTVNRRFDEWIKEQKDVGRTFTPEQMEWLTMIKDHIAASITIGIEDFELTPFYEKGGAYKAHEVFGTEFETIINELHEVLIV
jgi:type I restriction enzyme R subunit